MEEIFYGQEQAASDYQGWRALRTTLEDLRLQAEIFSDQPELVRQIRDAALSVSVRIKKLTPDFRFAFLKGEPFLDLWRIAAEFKEGSAE
jgi:hypothetical protein